MGQVSVWLLDEWVNCYFALKNLAMPVAKAQIIGFGLPQAYLVQLI
jgi:hypothetical protein